MTSDPVLRKQPPSGRIVQDACQWILTMGGGKPHSCPATVSARVWGPVAGSVSARVWGPVAGSVSARLWGPVAGSLSTENGQSLSSGSRGPGHPSPSASELPEEDDDELVEQKGQCASSSSLPSLVPSSPEIESSEMFCWNVDDVDGADDVTGGTESCSTSSPTPGLGCSAKTHQS